MQRVASYRPAAPVSGPAYSPWFKMLATLLSFGMAGYVASFLLRYRADVVSELLLLAAIASIRSTRRCLPIGSARASLWRCR